MITENETIGQLRERIKVLEGQKQDSDVFAEATRKRALVAEKELSVEKHKNQLLKDSLNNFLPYLAEWLDDWMVKWTFLIKEVDELTILKETA